MKENWFMVYSFRNYEHMTSDIYNLVTETHPLMKIVDLQEHTDGHYTLVNFWKIPNHFDIERIKSKF